MANFVDQDQQWLLDCLTSTLNTNQDVRSFVEASLQQASLQPGFGVALSKIVVNKEFPVGLLQVAAVLLKQFIKQHWQEDEESFIQPVVSIEENVISIFPSLLFLDLGYYLVDSYLLGNKHPLKSDTFTNRNEFCTVLGNELTRKQLQLV